MSSRSVACLALVLAAVCRGAAGPATPAGARSDHTVAPAANYGTLIERARVAPMTEFQRLFGEAVALRERRDGLDRPRAEIAVRRDLSAAAVRHLAWMEAVGHLRAALRIAYSLQDPQILLALHLAQARNYLGAGDRIQAAAELDAADQLAGALGDARARVDAGLLRLELYGEEGHMREVDALCRSLLALPHVDPLPIELRWARSTDLTDRARFHARWQGVLGLARAAGNRRIEGEALDALGRYALATGDAAKAVRRFGAAGAIGELSHRDLATWLDVIAADKAVHDRPRAYAAIRRALATTDENRDPDRAAALYTALADLRAGDGDFLGAYRDLWHADELRARRDAVRQFMPLARLTLATTPDQTDRAADLAAAHEALRESELTRARLRDQEAVGIAVTMVLVACLVGLAYLYQRRNAAALAMARDNAELRADRTHWQMLRYQLSPHFLFNALGSLGGLVVTDPPAATRVIDRLSEFCQLALEGSRDELRTLNQELALLRAYLDVETPCADDALRVRFEMDPEVRERRLPPLLLQPLVENALKFGRQTCEGLLEIVISARPGEGGVDLLLEVANTGRWVDSPGTDGRHATVGLANVRERLARCGAGPDALVSEATNGWVRVRLRVPGLSSLPMPV